MEVQAISLKDFQGLVRNPRMFTAQALQMLELTGTT